MIPAEGFSLAATVMPPRGAAPRVRYPAVILVPTGAGDRDATVSGIPILAQLAAALSDHGFLVVRYDRRSVGKSGGRDERATLDDYAFDVLSAYRWLKKRKDVDKRRITLVGHSQGSVVAMIAAAREEDVAGLVLIAAPSVKGSDLILEQQRSLLGAMNVTDAERKSKIDLQQRIHAAVLTGKGWESLPEDVRRQADTPFFKSLLEFDPAVWMRRVRQHVLIVQGASDDVIPPQHAETLAQLARQRNRNRRVETALLPGVNHLLVRAGPADSRGTGEVKQTTIVPDAAARIVQFLRSI